MVVLHVSCVNIWCGKNWSKRAIWQNDENDENDKNDKNDENDRNDETDKNEKKIIK